jgi:hypothetical protein
VSFLPMVSPMDRPMRTEPSLRGPAFVPQYKPKTGGVDFLGLRQVNLEMAAQLLPGINNVTRFVRPFSMVSWIYWKFHTHCEASGITKPTPQQLKVWKEKVETLFTWGHQLNAVRGVPGLDSKPPALEHAPLDFKSWRRTAENTSLMAAVQYGPASKTLGGLGFLEPVDREFLRTCGPGTELATALDPLLSKADESKLLSGLAAQKASQDDANRLFNAWSVQKLSHRERETFRKVFFDESSVGTNSPLGRRSTTVEMIRRILGQSSSAMSTEELRYALFHGRLSKRRARIEDSKLIAPWHQWIVLQMRQAQKLALESLLYWTELQLFDGYARDTESLTKLAIEETCNADATFSEGTPISKLYSRLRLQGVNLHNLLDRSETDDLDCLLVLMEDLRASIKAGEAFLDLSIRILFLCASYTETLKENPLTKSECRRGTVDRISLSYWLETLRKCDRMTLREFTRYMLEIPILSQHFTFAARRFDGQTQRLRIAVEEQGLELLADKPLRPTVTPDRLDAALSLMADCGLVGRGATSGDYFSIS